MFVADNVYCGADEFNLKRITILGDSKLTNAVFVCRVTALFGCPNSYNGAG